jgi:hypothetical protein
VKEPTKRLVVGTTISARSWLPDSTIANLHNKHSWENFVSFTTRSRKRQIDVANEESSIILGKLCVIYNTSKRQIDVANEESSIADTILPPGWTMQQKAN